MPPASRTPAYLASLVAELQKQPEETEWLEFKVDNEDPQKVGEYISALSNSAAANGKATAYLVWGVEDGTHNLVGTAFSPATARVGNEPLENWLLRALDPRIDFRFHEVALGGIRVVVLEIDRAHRQPVRFGREAFIRIGSVKKPLREAGDREASLWRLLGVAPFEERVAAEHLDANEVLQLLDFPKYFELLELQLPDSRDTILAFLADDRLIRANDAGRWDVTNLGGLLFAKKLSDFQTLERKAVRVIQYKGSGRVNAIRERSGNKGYASGFEGLLEYINGLLPSNEVIRQALRRTVPMFPALAIRELVANALIHQDLGMTGAGPMIEIFDDRVEITNPGEPLVATDRFVDSPPQSRNEALASLTRRFRICEERGSGIDKVVAEVEAYQLPAPLFGAPTGFTRVVLYAHRPVGSMDRDERIRACYQHACLKWVMSSFLTNSSLRERFGIEERNKATVSRYIRESVEAGAIRPYDATASRRNMKYVPSWA